MKFFRSLVYHWWFFFIFLCECECSVNKQINMTSPLSNIEEMNSILRKIMTHFKSSNASAEPLPIPDPFHRPDHEYGSPFTIKTTNVTIRGISNLKMNNFNSDLVAMKINFELHLPKLLESGNYWCVWPHCSGKFSLSITNAHWNCNAALKITESGRLAVSKIELDLKHRDTMEINIDNAGLFGIVVNNFGNLIFEGMKSYILSVININTEHYVNEQLKHMQIMLPNSIPPIDTFAIEARKFLKSSKYDPFNIPDYLYTTNVYLIEVSHISIHGLSSFYRTGNFSLSVKNDSSFQIIVNFGTDQLKGDCRWEIGMLGIYSKTGNALFNVDYVNIFLNVSQSLNLARPPVVTDINVKVGNIQLVLDGHSVFEYAIEFAVNLISNWIRNHITKLFKVHILYEVQNMVNKINMEDIILKHIINEKPMSKAALIDSIDMIMRSTAH